MKTRFLLLLSAMLLLISCTDDDNANPAPEPAASVLLLRVDYTTNQFEAGTELHFDSNDTFTISNEYLEPGDFGYLKLFWEEQDALLFDGEIHWAGTGELNFPTNFLPASSFDAVATLDFVTPANGFQNVFNPDSTTYDYLPMWSSVQFLVKVREYLQANPQQTAKVFLYTPSVGVGNPEEWDWYFILKK